MIRFFRLARREWRSPALLLALLFLTAAAGAHESRPLYIEVRETAPNHYGIVWKIPASVPRANHPAVGMPDGCRQTSPVVKYGLGDSHGVRTSYRCVGGVEGGVLKLHYPHGNPALSAMVNVVPMTGTAYTHLFPPGETHWQVPETPTVADVAGDYLMLGIEHIFTGIDHLLFVACLIFIARTPRKILLTITGFTLAHSVTLALATLEVVSLPVAPVEVSIALSIVFLAHEIAVGNKASWTWRYPVIVSTSFGLLHGFGFAALLGDLGLPRDAVVPALLFFNLGVEVGQLIFVGALAALFLVVRNWFPVDPTAGIAKVTRTTAVASYAIGTTGAFWLIERLSQF